MLILNKRQVQLCHFIYFKMHHALEGMKENMVWQYSGQNDVIPKQEGQNEVSCQQSVQYIMDRKNTNSTWTDYQNQNYKNCSIFDELWRTRVCHNYIKTSKMKISKASYNLESTQWKKIVQPIDQNLLNTINYHNSLKTKYR